MGFIKKAFKKLTGMDKVEAAANAPAPPPPAVTATIADKKEADTTKVETTSDKTATVRKGKKGLKIARSTGTGVNV